MMHTPEDTVASIDRALKEARTRGWPGLQVCLSDGSITGITILNPD